MYWFIYIVAIFLLIVYGKYRDGISLNEREPIFGVYRQPTNRSVFKFFFMYIILQCRKLWNYAKLEEETDERSAGADSAKVVAGYGTKSRATPLLMDCTQPLSAHPKAIDAVYFNGVSSSGWNLVVGTARRPHGVINGFLILKVPGIGILVSPKYPDTLMFQGKASEEFAAEGLELRVIQPMACWTLKYDGLLRVDKSVSEKYKCGQIIKARLNGLWSSDLPYFDFDTDMSPFSVANGMANELWTREYFKLLREIHQTHYEQFGDLTGNLTVEDEELQFNMQAVRDHSYGEMREWKNFHRYALHYIVLESGAKMNVGVVSMPIVFSSMQIGYLYTPQGDLVPLDKHSFRLHEHGEEGSPPTDYAFSFTAGGEVYHVKVQVVDSTSFNMGWEWEAQVTENFCQFEVNGVKGWGCAEFEYRHLNGRPETSSRLDPEWTKAINKG